ncbi:MAG: hypothetical protein ABI528_06150 [bacterium]
MNFFIKNLQTLWMYNKNFTKNSNLNRHTVFFNKDNVAATISLSYFGPSVSFDDGIVGAGGCGIKSFEYFDAGNNPHTITYSDWANNSVFVDKCSYITFQLNTIHSIAYAQGTIYYYGDDNDITTLVKKKEEQNKRKLCVNYNNLNGNIVSKHEFSIPKKLLNDRRVNKIINDLTSQELKNTPTGHSQILFENKTLSSDKSYKINIAKKSLQIFKDNRVNYTWESM